MPGSPFMMVGDSYQGVTGEGVPAAVGGGPGGIDWSFFLWLVVIGILIPSLVLGGLRAGGLQFVFRRR